MTSERSGASAATEDGDADEEQAGGSTPADEEQNGGSDGSESPTSSDSLLIDPEHGWILNYGATTLLAGVIAGFGMRLDSAPIVIGAMLVAPVMRPVLGAPGRH